jgi:hypothetical protein
MQIINNGLDRGVTDCNDLFMRYLTKDGMNNYPTIIFLLNRLFLKDTDRLGSHIGITDTVHIGDDVYWYKMLGFTAIKTRMNLLLKQNTNIFENINYFKQDSDETHGKIFNYWYTGNRHYANINNVLRVSSIGPFDRLSVAVSLETEGVIRNEEAGDIIDICRLNNDTDLILTETMVYLYKINTNTIIPRVPVKNADIYKFNALCCTTHYVVVACSNRTGGSGMGFYIVTNIDSEEEVKYSCPLYYYHHNSQTGTSYSNQLDPNDNYTLCALYQDDIIYINGTGGLKTFNCYDYIKNGSDNAISVAKEKGESSNNWGNKSIFFGLTKTYEGNKTFEISGGYRYINIDNYHIIIAKDNYTNRITLYTDVSIERNEYVLVKEPVKASNDITSAYIYNREQVFLFTSSGTTYVSLDKSDQNNPVTVYPASFHFETEKDKKEINILKVYCTFIDTIGFLTGEILDTWGKVNNRETTFLFFRILLPGGKAKWHSFGDDNRRDTTFRDMAEAFDTG